MDLKGLIISVIVAALGVIVSIWKRGYKQIGQGIAIGALIVGLPLTFFGTSAMGSLSSETTSTFSQMSTDLEQAAKDTMSKIKGYAGDWIPPDDI